MRLIYSLFVEYCISLTLSYESSITFITILNDSHHEIITIKVHPACEYGREVGERVK